MRVLFVTYGTFEAPATRYRVGQYFPYLEREGISYSWMSMISPSLTRFLIQTQFAGGMIRGIWILYEQILGFFKVAVRVPWYDLVFFQRAVFPFGCEKFIRLLNRKIIYDLDDAIYISVEQGGGFFSALKKIFKSKQVERVLRASACCICENNYIQTYVKKYCPRVSVITGPIDTERNIVGQRKDDKKRRLTIGWVGSPATSAYLDTVRRPLKELAQKFDFQVTLVGVRDYHMDGVRVVSRGWDVATEVRDIHAFDIGICPMPDNDWTRGKVSVKILQYMANGVPSVVSFTPTNEEIIRDGVDGFIARNDEEWVEKLSALLAHEDVRVRIGLAGRQKAERNYSLKANAPVFLGILRDMAQGSTTTVRKEVHDGEIE